MKVESIVVLKVRFPYGVFSKSLCRMRLTVFENIGFFFENFVNNVH